MSIEIKIYGDTAEDALRELRVFSDGAVPTRKVGMSPALAAPYGDGVQTLEGQRALNPDGEPTSEGVLIGSAPTRVPGQPSPGKARRTKAEIAEDEAAGNGNISTGGERVDPENPDDAETQAQDAADEQAEVEEGRDAEKPLSVDDVKALATEYQQLYGMEAVQEDGPKIFIEAVGKPPEGQAYWKFSILPTDQESLQKLANVWRKAIDLNPLQRAKVA